MLVSTVELFLRAHRAKSLGIDGTENLRFNRRAVIARKDDIVAQWSDSKNGTPAQLGVVALIGHGVFVGPQEISVHGRNYSADKFVIATGSKPARPPIPGAQFAITSDELIPLPEQPEQLVVIGGAFIGLEFGFALAWAGTQVTILQSGPEIALGLDDEIRQVLLDAAKETGIVIRTNVTVKAIGASKTVECEADRRVENFAANQVLLATGRPANVGPLQPPAAAIELDHGVVKVNEFLQSVSGPHIDATGDAADKRQHSPVAWYEGPIAAQNALRGNSQKLDFSVFPNAIFTIPAIGQVGLTEQAALSRGLKAKVGKLPYKYNPAAGVRNETAGMVRVVYPEGSEKILGVHGIGAHAEDIVQVAEVAIKGGLKKSEVGAMHYVFPTFGGAIFDTVAS